MLYLCVRIYVCACLCVCVCMCVCSKALEEGISFPVSFATSMIFATIPPLSSQLPEQRVPVFSKTYNSILAFLTSSPKSLVLYLPHYHLHMAISASLLSLVRKVTLAIIFKGSSNHGQDLANAFLVHRKCLNQYLYSSSFFWISTSWLFHGFIFCLSLSSLYSSFSFPVSSVEY